MMSSMKKKGGEVLSRFGKSASGTGVTAGLAKGGTKSVGKSIGKTTAKKITQKAVQKAGQKALTKGIAKSAAKAIPGVGSLISGIEAAGRLAKGDVGGAALSAGEAIPGVGLGFAAANIARDVSKAKKAASAVKTITKAKRAKDAVKVVTPTVVGSTADKLAVVKKKVGQFAKTPTGAATVVGGGALTGKGIEKNIDPRKLRPPAVKGGRAGKRSAGQ